LQKQTSYRQDRANKVLNLASEADLCPPEAPETLSFASAVNKTARFAHNPLLFEPLANAINELRVKSLQHLANKRVIRMIAQTNDLLRGCWESSSIFQRASVVDRCLERASERHTKPVPHAELSLRGLRRKPKGHTTHGCVTEEWNGQLARHPRSAATVAPGYDAAATKQLSPLRGSNGFRTVPSVPPRIAGLHARLDYGVRFADLKNG
jgi:hypothetical protein